MPRVPALVASALALLMLVPMSAAIAADIGLSPARMTLTVAPGGSASAESTVFSTSANPVPLTVSLGDWSEGSDGKLRFLPAGSSAYSATPWVTLSSSSLAVAPNGKSSVRVTVQVPDDPSLAGTYQTVVFFTTQPKVGTGKGAKFVTRQRLGLIVYVNIAGTSTKGSELSDMYVQGKTLTVVLSNTGNSLMRAAGKVELRDASGKTVATLPVNDVPVMRESERDLALPLPANLGGGYYVALAVIDDSRGGSLVGQLPFQLGN